MSADQTGQQTYNFASLLSQLTGREPDYLDTQTRLDLFLSLYSIGKVRNLG